jgi:hypothetical protein
MTKRQIEVLQQITARWNLKKRGTHVDRKIAETVHSLNEVGEVVLCRYTLQSCGLNGWIAYPAGCEI